MTIVGFERKEDGSKNIIVFDPMFHDATNVTKLIDIRFMHKQPEDVLRAYRRGVKYLKKYNEFELLK
jgi:zinc finger-containing ubiquitin peptidase 1